jgi:hypothetical protein
VGFLWPTIFSSGVQISFAHKTFKWSNEARGIAAVYVVIVGFCKSDARIKKLYIYDKVDGDPHLELVKNINPYLIEGNNIIIGSRQKPICSVPEMNFGNMPAEGGEYLFTNDEKEQFIKEEPGASSYFKEIISAHEFLNGKKRFCLWLEDISPTELKTLPKIYNRVQNVREIRLKSSRPLITCLKLVGADISFLAICRIALDDVLFFVVFRILFSEPGELFNADMFSRRDPEDKGGNAAAAAAPVLDDVDIEDEEIMGMSVVINDLPSFGPMCCKC